MSELRDKWAEDEWHTDETGSVLGGAPANCVLVAKSSQDERERRLRQAWKANVDELTRMYGDSVRQVIAEIVAEAEHDAACATPDGWRDTRLVKAILKASDTFKQAEAA